MTYVLPMPEWLRIAVALFFVIGIIAGIVNIYHATRDIIDYKRKRKR
jgi:hypothetical protein